MAALYIGTYDIVDPDEFRKYPPLVLALLPKYGGEVLASDTAGVLVEGAMRTMNAALPALPARSTRHPLNETSTAPSAPKSHLTRSPGPIGSGIRHVPVVTT